MMTTYPRIAQVVLDTTSCRALAEFHRELFGLTYRPGDELPPAGEPDRRVRTTGHPFCVLVR